MLRKGPTCIAQNTNEMIAYDKLNARDKELLEKSQVILGLSKLYEMEKKDAKTSKNSQGFQQYT